MESIENKINEKPLDDLIRELEKECMSKLMRHEKSFYITSRDGIHNYIADLTIENKAANISLIYKQLDDNPRVSYFYTKTFPLIGDKTQFIPIENVEDLNNIKEGL